jgi:hypothetical protein
MDKIITSVRLMTKTGRFFANCDGNYDIKERQLIYGFAKSVNILSDLNKIQQDSVEDAANQDCTLDELIQETEELLSQYNAEERQRLLEVYNQYVRMTIEIDNRITREEVSSYKEWCQRLGIKND